MDKVYTSFEAVSRAYNKVRRELWDLGVLWKGSRLDRVPCFYDPVAPVSALCGVMGWYNRRTKAISFPSVYLPVAALLMDISRKASAVNVLRHEYAHAIADLYKRAVSNGTFRAAFGGACGDDPPERGGAQGHGEGFVSEYAKKSTEEDFAETFMLYVRHGRKIPAKYARDPAIRGKWKAVDRIVRRIAAYAR